MDMDEEETNNAKAAIHQDADEVSTTTSCLK